MKLDLAHIPSAKTKSKVFFFLKSEASSHFFFDKMSRKSFLAGVLTESLALFKIELPVWNLLGNRILALDVCLRVEGPC